MYKNYNKKQDQLAGAQWKHFHFRAITNTVIIEIIKSCLLYLL